MSARTNRSSSYRIGTGATSLLMIIVILCMTIMSVLGLTAAVNEQQLQCRSADVNRSVTEAESRAQRVLAQLNAMIVQGSGDLPEHCTMDDGMIVYTDMVTDTLTLCMTVKPDGDSCRVVGYSISAEEAADNMFTEDRYLHVLQGGDGSNGID